MGVQDAERLAQLGDICPSIGAGYEGIGGILGKEARGERASSALDYLPEPKDKQLRNHSGEHGFWKQVEAARKQADTRADPVLRTRSGADLLLCKEFGGCGAAVWGKALSLGNSCKVRMVAQSLNLGQLLSLGKTCGSVLGSVRSPSGPDMTCVPQAPSLIRSTSYLLAVRLRIVSLRCSAVRSFQRPWFR